MRRRSCSATRRSRTANSMRARRASPPVCRAMSGSRCCLPAGAGLRRGAVRLLLRGRRGRPGLSAARRLGGRCPAGSDPARRRAPVVLRSTSSRTLGDDVLAADALPHRWSAPGRPTTSRCCSTRPGSTGAPRGVVAHPRQPAAQLRRDPARVRPRPESRGVIWLPPYHDMGLIGGILQPRLRRLPLRLMSPLDVPAAARCAGCAAICDHGATTSGGPNFAYDLCLRRITPRPSGTASTCRAGRSRSTAPSRVRADTLERSPRRSRRAAFARRRSIPATASPRRR